VQAVDTSGHMVVRTVIATFVAALVLAAPAAAATTLDPLKACYVSDGQAATKRETINIHATGFTPQSTVDLQIDGTTVDTGIVDAFGETSATIPAPFQGAAGGGERQFTLTITEQGNPANFVSAVSRVSNLAVTLRPNRAKPSRKVRFRGRGFTNDAPVYAHYVFGGKLQRTVRLVRRPVLPCGSFSVKRKQIPVKDARVGDWTLQVDQQRRYVVRPTTSNWQTLIIHVRQLFLQP
jgi:hypothetical protein